MAVRIRLRRTGGRNEVHYRVVAADVRSPRDGRFIEQLGWYDPGRKDPNYKLDLDRIAHWQGRGALVSDTVRKLVKRAEQAAAAETAVASEPAAGAADGQ